ncbi:SGNH/GDSL hydrolase family protein [Actinomadura rudentiformis]|uniref:SGNH/GDSL hydrolase family protein n=1 Tax=Actinomadura rudentiformis TaxID=359158 RepID=A0A6H9YHK5_9ACTN|nr:SGNH/GDSL hydrolase family protein [Actinomadura rudentiformis]KAB2343445.1 SGNH/GDSL hydrolase family protein [Actinomadura rudentiformis]
MSWTRYVAIGDSFTEGLGDPYPGGGWRGWADRVAEGLATANSGVNDGVMYANLAIRGRLLDPIVTEQLPAALELKPDLVSMSGGGNDMLRPGADLDALAGKLDEAVGQIRATGADVVLFTAVDPVGSPVIRLTRSRVEAFSDQIRLLGAKHGAYVVDQWQMDVLRDWRMWTVDRLHMSPAGHRRVALATLEKLGVPADDWRDPVLDPLPELGRGARMLWNARWARGHLAPWVGRRIRGRSSGDLITAKRPTFRPVIDQSG